MEHLILTTTFTGHGTDEQVCRFSSRGMDQFFSAAERATLAAGLPITHHYPSAVIHRVDLLAHYRRTAYPAPGAGTALVAATKTEAA